MSGIAAANPDHPPIPTPESGNAPSLIVEWEALLPGPRGRIAVTVSVRFVDDVEIWLYAAENGDAAPVRGLWRWRRGRWEVLSGGRGLDPRALTLALADPGFWVNPPPPSQRDAAIVQLRRALRG